MLRGQEGTKQRSPESMPSVLKEYCHLLFLSKFDENCRIMKLKMIKIHFFSWPDSKYKFFQPFTLFSTSLLCFPLELIKKKNQTAIGAQSSRWRGREFRISSGHLLPPRRGAQLLLPELGASVPIRQDNGLNKAPWLLVGCWELGSQQHEDFLFFLPGRIYVQGCLKRCQPQASSKDSQSVVVAAAGEGGSNTSCTILTKHWHLYQPAGDRGCCLVSVVSIQTGGDVGEGLLNTADLNLAAGCCF